MIVVYSPSLLWRLGRAWEKYVSPCCFYDSCVLAFPAVAPGSRSCQQRWRVLVLEAMGTPFAACCVVSDALTLELVL